MANTIEGSERYEKPERKIGPDKSTLVTGAARGIGRDVAEAYIAEGATVAIGDINLEAAEATAQALGDAAYAVRLDVRDQASIDSAIASVVGRAGKLDILINNAALFDAAETVNITRESFDRLYAVNVAGTLFTMQAAARQMIAQDHGGKIINMASQAGRQGKSLVLVYRSTKAAVISVTQSAGAEPDQPGHQPECHCARGGGRRTSGAYGFDVCQTRRQGAWPAKRPKSAPGCRRGGSRCLPIWPA